MYCETTEGITITVKPYFLDERSAPEKSHFVWAYHVRIENNGGRTVQLRNRHWRITDLQGRTPGGAGGRRGRGATSVAPG